ncbi:MULTISPECIES: ATP-binding cassette domain-containing protein [Nocardioides]|uniref:ATP-binding cassette domain-containing protein n=1 Tax=Nocardioides vastitatis TaxID=2568655 RepID=A0ABW0ZDK3_9ACTN|nr:ABC transporter ATP-binding protein [Nocardioides sp.]
MASIAFDQVELTYPGSTTAAVKDLGLEIEDGEFMVPVGPAGCGKSTSLRMLAGPEEATNGRILIGAEDVTRRAPEDRDIAMLFQNYALYPHMRVADHMAFSLRMAGVQKDASGERLRP